MYAYREALQATFKLLWIKTSAEWKVCLHLNTSLNRSTNFHDVKWTNIYATFSVLNLANLCHRGSGSLFLHISITSNNQTHFYFPLFIFFVSIPPLTRLVCVPSAPKTSGGLEVESIGIRMYVSFPVRCSLMFELGLTQLSFHIWHEHLHVHLILFLLFPS